MASDGSIRVVATDLTIRGFEAFGKVVPLKDFRSVSSMGLSEILQDSAEIGKPTAASGAFMVWADLAGMEMSGRDVTVTLVRVKKRPLVCDLFERHIKGPQLMIPLDERGMVIAVMPANDLENPKAEPPLEGIRAFLWDGSKAIILNKGTWYWPPFPLAAATSTFLAVQLKGTYKEDTTVRAPRSKVVIEL